MADWTHTRTYSPTPDPESKKNDRHLYGPIARMLVEGGQRDLDGPERTWVNDRDIPRKPKTVEVYEGEYITEPDPNVSDLKSTWTLVCFMLQRDWTSSQIAAALLSTDNVGGEFYRFEASRSDDGGSGFLSRLIEGSYRSTPQEDTMADPDASTSSPYSHTTEGAIGGREQHVWRENDRGFVLKRKDAGQLLGWIARAEPTERTKNALIEKGPLHRKVTRSYLQMLEERRIVTVTERVVQTKAGKRQSKVVTLEETGPLDFVDRLLWKQARELAEVDFEVQVSPEEIAALGL